MSTSKAAVYPRYAADQPGPDNFQAAEPMKHDRISDIVIR